MITAVRFVSQLGIQRVVPAAEIELIYLLEPVSALFIGVFLGGELMTGIKLAGCLAIALGIALPLISRKSVVTAIHS